MNYIIPFKERPVVIYQGFCGKISHMNYPEVGNDMRYSIDFLLPVGTEIIASREGVVVLVKDEGKKKYGGYNSKLINKAFIEWMNVIEILHDDGSIGAYSHLKHKGSFVKVGDRVEQGQVIGLSGLTGWIKTPHLDFCVYKWIAETYKIKTIKIKFKDYKGALYDSRIKKPDIDF
jgi:murein DD-endopeptidase MepM/ murein hydrolase activator NlpD